MLPPTQITAPVRTAPPGGSADGTEAFAPFLKAYRDELPVFRRQADQILRYYGHPVEPEDLVQMTALRLWRRRDSGRVCLHAPAIFFFEMREHVMKAVRARQSRRRALDSHIHHLEVGMAWERGGDPVRHRHTRKVRQTTRDRLVGPRLLPTPAEIALSPACAAFLHVIQPLLDQRDLAALALFYMASYPTPEIARALRLTRACVEHRLKRARRQLRQHPHLAEILRGERETLPAAEMAVAQ